MDKIAQDNSATNLRINEDAFLKLRKRRKILEQGTGHFTGYPSIDMPWLKYYTEEQIMAPIPHGITAYDYLRILNNNNLDLPAIEFLGKQWTFKELFEAINDTTKALHAIGVKPGDIVTIVLPACPEETFLFYAIDQIGACANFIFPGTSISEIEETIYEFNSKHLILFDQILAQSPKLQNDSSIKKIYKSYDDKIKFCEDVRPYSEFMKEGFKTEMPIYKRDTNSPLFIAKTGGSTGKPKSVLLSDESFNLQVHQHLNSPIDYSAGDRWVRVWPLFSASCAVSSHHLPLCYGMNTIIEPAIDIDKLDELILNYRPSHMMMIASCIESLLKSELMKGKDLSFIKTMGLGGEGVTGEFEKKAEDFMIEHNITSSMTYGYGMTENSSGATSRFNRETSSVGGVGVPQVNTIVSIFDPETEEELSYGEEGEICVLSSNFMLGYYNDPKLTASVLKQHKDGNVWLHSGDLGYMDENGHLFVKGRTKRMIMLFSGNKIYPLDIEEMIETIDEVDRAIIVSEPDPIHEGSVVPCAFVTLNTQLNEQELREKINTVLGEKMANYVNLNSIHILEKLPHIGIGKVDLQKLERESYRLSKRNN